MKKNVLVLGATGKLGQQLVKTLLENKLHVTALVRSPQKIAGKHKSLNIIKGDVMDGKTLDKVLINKDAIVSVLGHGIRTDFPIQEKTMKVLIPLMENRGIKRLITITGEGLILKDDKSSLITSLTTKLLSIVDPYRVSDAITQQRLIEKSSLDFTVIRTPVHSNIGSSSIKHSGYQHAGIFQTVTRKAISNFIVSLIKENTWIRKSPIIY